jgi:putative endonuclease
LGRAGELKAAEFLKKAGYKIIKKNYRTPFGEIDIIALDGETLVFVEVKTRSSDDYGAPSEAVNQKKQEKYVRTALSFLQKEKKTDFSRISMTL